MDPVQFKLIQLLIAELLGGALCLLGVYLLIRGVAGKSTLIVKASNINAKLLNASPGLLICIVGGIILFFSLNQSKIRVEEQSSSFSTEEVLESWLSNSSRIKGDENYKELMDIIIGSEPVRKVQQKNLSLETDSTLGKIAEKEYLDQKFWRLIAAINKDEKYYDFKMATKDTAIKAGSLIQLWHVSKHYGQDRKTIIQVSGADAAAFYEGLLRLADSGVIFNDNVFGRIDQQAKQAELSLLLSPANLSGGVATLGDLSLKYYGDKKYWKLIAWANKGKFQNANAGTPIPVGDQLWIIHVVP